MNEEEVLRLCLLRIVGPARKMLDKLLECASENRSVHNVIDEYRKSEEYVLDKLKHREANNGKGGNEAKSPLPG